MDNTPKDQNQDQSQPQGEIFNNNSADASYSQATSLPETETASPFASAPVEPDTGIPPVEQGLPLEGNGENPPPPDQSQMYPPFVEDKKKKFIIIGLLILAVVVILFFVVGILRGKKPEPVKNINLTYWGLWEDKTIIQPILNEYNKSHPNVTVNYVLQDKAQYRERLQASIEKGDGPDIFRFHNTWIPMLVRDLAPVPQNIYTVDEFGKIFYPVATSDLKVGNGIYGIPLEIDGLVLFYNENILKSANVPVPSTWVDVQDSVSKLTVKENKRIVTSAIALGGAENIEHFSDILGLMFLQNGVVLNKSLNECTDKTKKNCASETLAYYRKFIELPNNTWDETLDNSIVAFAGGKVAMMIAPSWQALTIKKIKPSFEFKVAQIPQLPCDRQPCTSVNWATYWVEGVNSRGKNQQAAWDFLKYLSDENTMKKIYNLQVKSRELFGEPYSRISLGKTLSDNPYIGPLLSEASTMKSFYFASRTYDGDSGLNSSLIKYMKDAINKMSEGTSPEEAVKFMENGFNQVYSRFGLTTSAQ